MATREKLMDAAYFDKTIDHIERSTARFEERLRQPDIAKPQILLHALFRNSYQSLIARYSRGDAVATLAPLFPPIVDAWERSLRARGAEAVSLKDIDDYVLSLWVISLAILVDADAALFDRVLACIGNAGEDKLLERLVASRVAGRPAAETLLWPRPYAPLFEAMEAAPAERPKLLQKFLNGWYKSLRRCYWHENHTGPEGGGFFGYWCIEAAGVVKAFHFDDESIRGMPYYPGDLVAGA